MMAELLVRSTDTAHADPVKNVRGCWKRGMVVQAFPDGTYTQPMSPNNPFVLIRIPTVSVATVRKYVQPDYDPTDFAVRGDNADVTRRRRWVIRWADLPVAARNTLRDNRELTIAVPAWAGARDYTWAQVRQYFRDQQTGLDETASL